MKKYFYVALLALVSATMFVACGPKNKSTDDEEPTEGKTYAGDTWITSPDQFDPSLVNDSVNSCWEWHVWCDGTTIGVVPFWGTEAQLLWMIDQTMKAELKVFGEYHKKYRYYLVEENTEKACLARQWEGAECWLETITYPDKNGVKQTSEEYCWLPEKNIKERHDYYLAHLEQLGVVSHTYERVTDKKDRDACIALNPEDIDNGDWNSTAPYGSILRMAELDSVTLDTTGVFYYTMCLNSQGAFSFDSVSLKSPYVMLELAPVAESAYWRLEFP